MINKVHKNSIGLLVAALFSTQFSYSGVVGAIDPCTVVFDILDSSSFSYSPSSSFSSSDSDFVVQNLIDHTNQALNQMKNQFKRNQVDESYEASAHILCKYENEPSSNILRYTLYFYPGPVDENVQPIDRYEHFDAETTSKMNHAILLYALGEYKQEKTTIPLPDFCKGSSLFKPSKIFE